MKSAGETQAGEAPVEQIVPQDTSADGDFGAGTLELEQDLLSKISEPEPTATTEPITAEPKTEPVVVDPKVEGPLFDINGKLSVKAGESLSAEHVKELERGWLREADYTQKTQQIAEMREAAQYVLEQQDRIQNDPKALREFFEDKHILSAFNKQEMLNYGLEAGGVPVQVWNQFLNWYNESGLAPQQGQAPQADPYIRQFAELNKRIETFGKSLEQINAERVRQQQLAVQAQQSSEKQEAFRQLDVQVANALTKYPGVDKNDLIVKMAVPANNSKTVEELAKGLHDQHEARFAAYVKSKQQTKQNTTKVAKGQPVNVVRRAPKTFEEASELVSGMLSSRGGNLAR